MENQKYMRDAAECALKFKEIYSASDSNVQAYIVFEALAKLTISDLKSERSVEDCQYTANEISEKLMRKNQGDLIKRKLDDLIKNRISRHTETFNKIALENKLSAIPTVKKTETTGKHPNKYCIGYKELNNFQQESSKNSMQEEMSEKDKSDSEQEKNLIQNKITENNIEYSVEHIKLSHFNWMYNYEIKGFRIFTELFNLIFCVLLIIFYIYIVKKYYDGECSFTTFLNMSFVTAVFLIDAKRKLDGILKRIVPIIPPYFAPSEFLSTQLECIATDKTNLKTGNPIRRIQLVSYWATCPICKEELQRNVRIELKKGGKEFPNRLIGCCSESPTEHIYSFDRITRIGKPLRK
jgi:hypothetical protein